MHIGIVLLKKQIFHFKLCLVNKFKILQKCLWICIKFQNIIMQFLFIKNLQQERFLIFLPSHQPQWGWCVVDLWLPQISILKHGPRSAVMVDSSFSQPFPTTKQQWIKYCTEELKYMYISFWSSLNSNSCYTSASCSDIDLDEKTSTQK